MVHSPELSIVIPVYCEEQHLVEVIQTIHAHVQELNTSYEFILVDDGSTDNTWTILVEQAAVNPWLRPLRLSRNFGKEQALSAGLDVAGGQAVLVMDGDLQHPPELIGDMVRIWRETDAEVVLGKKRIYQRDSLLKRGGSRLFYWMLRVLSGYDLRAVSDFRLMDRRVVDAWKAMEERTIFFRGMMAWMGFKQVDIFFDVPPRIGGASGWSVLRLAAHALRAIVAFSSRPLYLIIVGGVVFFIMGVVLGLMALYQFAVGTAVSGFTTVILLILIASSLLMFGQGLIGIYLAGIYNEIKRRPRYIIAQAINHDSPTE